MLARAGLATRCQGIRCYTMGTERCLFFMLGEQGFSTNADNYWDGWEPIRGYLTGTPQDGLGYPHDETPGWPQ